MADEPNWKVKILLKTELNSILSTERQFEPTAGGNLAYELRNVSLEHRQNTSNISAKQKKVFPRLFHGEN